MTSETEATPRAVDGATPSRSRYVIGIDLGTTNTAVAFVDTRAADPRVQVFDVPQLVAPAEVATRTQLPSFLYLAGDHDLAPAQRTLPWDLAGTSVRVVGELARAEGARQPQRMVASAKSWLCHPGVDRHGAILPWGIDEVDKVSPVDASAEVLAHVARAWDHAHGPEARLGRQDVIVTVPASFDEAARELTLEAAAKAGLAQPVLLEEPQAAFYAWMESHAVAASLSAGEHILVFDVGGGTSDFTIIRVGEGAQSFERIAVGDHLLLGGDNIDLTLARRLEARLVERGAGGRLDSVGWQSLVHACRLAKETLLSPDSVRGGVDALPITMPGRGTKLIGGTIKETLTRAELEDTLFSGFFPVVADKPGEAEAGRRRTRSGLQEFGLPYATEPAITRHLGAFLHRHAIVQVDAVLFNGGAMTPDAVRGRVLDQVARWNAEGKRPRELVTTRPELAVAEGAAHYGLVRRGLGTRIGGGLARSFYAGAGRDVAGAEQAVCLAARGLAEGARVELPREFKLVTNRPVSFKLFSSTTRSDQPGTIVPVGDGRALTIADGSDLLELPPIVTVLRAQGLSEVDVHLEVAATEVGTLDVFCREARSEGEPRRWRLSFDMRAGGAVNATADADDQRVTAAQALIRSAFSAGADEVSTLTKKLEQVLQVPRDRWSMSSTRALFDAAFEVTEGRKRSAQHEARWLNLVGFCLRPGCGAPADEWRAKQMWGVVFHEDLVFAKDEQCRLAWWITWRRIAGGLSKGQQHQLYLRLAQLFVPSSTGKKRWYEMKPSRQEAGEMLRCVGNLERCTPEQKVTLGREIVRRLGESGKVREDAVHFWAMGRLGARAPLYGPLESVVPPAEAAAWIRALLAVEWPDPGKAAFPMAQLARRTNDRARDVDDATRAALAARLASIEGASRSLKLVTEAIELDEREEYLALGDSLPAGLRLAGQGGT
jgi:molecular chaperone DnaK (HSP70)